MRWQTVHKDRVLGGLCHECFVDLIGLEDGRTLRCLMLLTHGDANVRVDRICPSGGLHRIMCELQASARLLADGNRLVNDLKLRLVVSGCCHGAVRAEQSPSQNERMTYVVSVTDI